MNALAGFLKRSSLSITGGLPRAERQQIISVLLMIGIVLMASRLLTNGYEWLRTSSPERATRVVSGLVTIVIFALLWRLNRRGSVLLAGLLYSLTLLDAAFAISTDPAWQDTLILYALPTLVPSFAIGPAASFIFAALSAVAHWFSFHLRDATATYNYTIVPSLFVLAALSWYAARYVEKALHAARQSREAQQETAQTLQALIQASPLPIMTLDTDGHVRIWNPAAERLFGWSAEEVLNGPEPMIPEEAEAECAARRARVLQGETITGAEARYRKKDGSPVDIAISAAPLRNARGEINGIVAIMGDLTERKRMEEALRQQNEYLVALHETTLGLINHLDVADLLTDIVARAAALLGTPHGFLYLVEPDGTGLALRVGLGVFQKYAHARLRKGEGLSGKVWESGRPLAVDDYSAWPGRSAQFAGDPFHATIGAPLPVGSEVMGVIGASYTEPGRTFGPAEVDLLSRFAQLASIALDNARLHESLQETNAQLREALQAKEEMIQNVSHELRTPLTLIKGYAETLLGGVFGELDERQREAVAIILRKAETLARLVNGLLTLQTFSAEDLRREPVDVNDLLASLGRDWRQPAQEAQVKVEVRLADSPLRVQADADRLREVLDQLVDNALKFRGDGGLVRLEAAGAGKKVRLAVSDDGIGIPPDKLGKVFERFYQVDGSSKRRYGGAGIGLTLARTIVEAHGGQVWAESPGRLGRGTTIVIELPSA